MVTGVCYGSAAGGCMVARAAPAQTQRSAASVFPRGATKLSRKGNINHVKMKDQNG